MNPQPKDEIVSSIERVLKESVAGLPAGCASMRRKTQEEFRDGIWFEVIPRSPTAAKVGVILDNGETSVVHVVLGDYGTTIEVLAEKKWRSEFPYLEDLHTLLSAVIAGKVEETVWVVGNRVCKSNLKIEMGGELRNWSFRHGFYPFSRTRKIRIKYSPYCASGS